MVVEAAAGDADGHAQKVFVRAASKSAGCPATGADGSAGPVASADAQHAARINMDVVPNAPTTTSSSSSSGSPQLDTARQRSSIPIAAGTADAVPKHQDGAAADVWMYPSQQQFYNAMKRKGWDPQAQDMSAIVSIHNTVNERVWQHILAWEALHACECAQPKLKRFQGKPNEYSPKARLMNMMGYKLPFDRHDWVVDRCGTDVRYVIDFYTGRPNPLVPVSMHLDVRPALDSWGAAWDRLRMHAAYLLSGDWRK